MSLSLLKRACDRYGQRKVAQMIGKSATTVNLILKGKYPKPEPILKTVNEIFNWIQSNEVTCPVLGKLHIGVCQKYHTWSSENKIHKDRFYREVKDICKNCTKGVSNV